MAFKYAIIANVDMGEMRDALFLGNFVLFVFIILVFVIFGFVDSKRRIFGSFEL